MHVPSNGRVIYKDSLRVAVLTGLHRPSQNKKTGDQLQLFILTTENPMTAIKQGSDEAVCGACPLRGHGCYVTVWQAPYQVWKKYHRDPVQPIPEHLRTSIRLGAYGDVAFLPPALVEDLIRGNRHTSYTHQWHEPWAPDMASHSMASVEPLTAQRMGVTALELKRKANAMGYRTYRALLSESDTLDKDEILCPNFTNPAIQCARCLLCNGNKDGNRKNIAIPIHGSKATQASFHQ